mgnify:CR=1 FL=1
MAVVEGGWWRVGWVWAVVGGSGCTCRYLKRSMGWNGYSAACDGAFASICLQEGRGGGGGQEGEGGSGGLAGGRRREQ